MPTANRCELAITKNKTIFKWVPCQKCLKHLKIIFLLPQIRSIHRGWRLIPTIVALARRFHYVLNIVERRGSAVRSHRTPRDGVCF